ncbi:MAG: Ig-like domain-containing protein [Vicinamibacterales bacterium]
MLEKTHVYTGSPGQPFTATISVFDGANTYTDTFKVQIQAKTLDVEVNMAIDKSLWYLHKTMTLSTSGAFTTGYWTSNNINAATSAATQAFEINGHRENGNVLEDPYVDNAGRGLRFLQQAVSSFAIAAQTYGNPDSNGNGLALRTVYGHEVYVGGQIVDAFVASATPNKIAVVGPRAGQTYKTIVADLMDAYSWGQDDFDTDRGGWIYNFNSQGGIDSSSSQWWAIGAHAADVWDTGIVPPFVREQNWTVGIPALQNWGLNNQSPGTGNHGGCSYRGFGSDTHHARTASCLVMMSADNVGKTDTRWLAAESWERRNFVTGGGSLHGRNANGTGARDLYSMFALAKAMRLAKDGSGASAPIELLGGDMDWYRADPVPAQPWNRTNGFARNLVGTQNADGSFPDEYEFGTGQLSTAVGTIILSPTLFELGPVAACTADPLIDGTAALGGETTFDGSGSVHQDPDYAGGLTYAWNFQDGDTGSGVSLTHVFDNVGIYNVTLTVTDDSGLSNTTSCPVDVRSQDIPPNANIVVTASQPICAGDTVTLDGSSSTDLDTQVVLWEWDTVNPINFGSIDHTGPVIELTFPTAGTYDVGLRVTDEDANGANSDSEFASIVVIPADDPTCNQPPTADGQSLTTPEDTPLAITLTAADPDGDALAYTILSGPSNGALSGLAPNVTYTPNLDYNGPDSFTFTVNDGRDDSNVATVTIDVTPVNDPPVANPDSKVTPEDTPVGGTVTSSDVDGGAPTYSLATAPSHGAAAVDADGTYTYTPEPDYSGPDSFTYTVSDGNGGTDTETVTIDVTPVNDPPVADPDAKVTPEDTPVDGNLTSSDVDGGSPAYSLATPPTNGGVVVNADGSYTYTPNLNYVGPDSFTYTVDDGNGGTDTETVTIDVTPVNDPPVANPDSKTTPEDTPVNGAVTSSDVDGGAPTYSLATAPSHGAVAVNADGTYTYTPEPDYNGPDSFTYTVDDGNGGTDTETVTIDVTPVNDPPVANPDAKVTPEDTPVSGAVTSSDLDGGTPTYSLTTPTTHGSVVVMPNGGYTYTPNSNYVGPDSFIYTVNDGNGGTSTSTVTLDVTPVNDPPVANPDAKVTPEDTPVSGVVTASDVDGGAPTYSLVSGVSHGTLTLDAAGAYTYTPALNYNGPDSFTFQVADGNGGTATAVVSITVTPVNDKPVAVDDSYTGQWNTPLTIAAPGVLTNDSDVDGDTLTAIKLSNPASGMLTFNANGGFTFMPAMNFSGKVSFTYKANDGSLDSNVARVRIKITTPCRTRNAYGKNRDGRGGKSNDRSDDRSDDRRGGKSDDRSDDKRGGKSDDRSDDKRGGKSRDGRSNDHGSRDHGSRDWSDDRSSDDRSSDSGYCAPGTPVGHKDHYTTKKNTPLSVAVNKGVIRNDWNTASVTVISGPSRGTVTLAANGSFLYMPLPGFAGDDVFYYVPRSAAGVAGKAVQVSIRVRGHWDGDNCDHDKKKHKHKKGDNCDHDRDHD